MKPFVAFQYSLADFFNHVSDLDASPAERSSRYPIKPSQVCGSIRVDMRLVDLRLEFKLRFKLFEATVAFFCLKESKKEAPELGFELESEPQQGLTGAKCTLATLHSGVCP